MDDFDRSFGQFFARMIALALALAALVWIVRGGLWLLNQ